MVEKLRFQSFSLRVYHQDSASLKSPYLRFVPHPSQGNPKPLTGDRWLEGIRVRARAASTFRPANKANRYRFLSISASAHAHLLRMRVDWIARVPTWRRYYSRTTTPFQISPAQTSSYRPLFFPPLLPFFSSLSRKETRALWFYRNG